MSDPIRTLAHVKISRNDEGLFSVLVNGEEMGKQILAEGFSVEFPTAEAEMGTARIHMTLAAEVELDLPDAEVEIKSDARKPITWEGFEAAIERGVRRGIANQSRSASNRRRDGK